MKPPMDRKLKLKVETLKTIGLRTLEHVIGGAPEKPATYVLSWTGCRPP